eukprot:g5233.t1
MNALRSLTKQSVNWWRPVNLRWLTSSVHSDRESIQYDVCIVGGGPAGLSAAIRTRQLAQQHEKDISVCVVEKGSEIGSHVISGCVMDPRSLDELIPDWKSRQDLPKMMIPAKQDKLRFLTENRSFWMPVLPQLKNKGSYIVSLSEFCRWLGSFAESIGVDLFPGFAAEDVIHKNGSITGVSISDKGKSTFIFNSIGKDGKRKSNFEPGVLIKSRVTLLAEGCRGSISQQVMKTFNLRQEVEHQTYGLGIKEVWEVPSAVHKEGSVLHTIGYPLTRSAYGGGFLYHMPNSRVSVGLVTGLDYENPHLSPFQEFQKFKSHPLIKNVLEGGKCLEYGARTLNEGGLQSLPRLDFPGGALIGCGAGFMNSLRLKGTHGAMKSGILAAEALMQELATKDKSDVITMKDYPNRFQNSWLFEELNAVRNVRPLFRYGLLMGMLSSAVHGVLLRGSEPWTFKNRFQDHELTRPAKKSREIDYSKKNNEVCFDITASLFNSGTNHDHDQPPHLKILNQDLPTQINLPIFKGPETKYCPAGVYEYHMDNQGKTRLHINAQNCLHCKACDIKDPMKNIRWTVPEGGDGPNYTML